MALGVDCIDCSMCTFVSPNIRSYVSHVRLVHCKDLYFHLHCGINNCSAQFKTFGAFNSHVYRHHRSSLQLTFASDTDQLLVNEPCKSCDSTVNSEGIYSVFSQSMPIQQSPQKDSSFSSNDSQWKSAKFLLQLSQQHHLSHSAISDVIKGCRDQSLHISHLVASLIANRLLEIGLDPNVISEVCSIDDSIPEPFSGLETNYLQEKYFQENFPYVKPQEITFGSPYYINRFYGNKREMTQKQDKFYYIPLLKTLQTILCDKGILNEVLTPRENNGNLSDFCDGSLYYTHSLFSIDQQALQIIAYFDELEVANPLGSYVSKHKLGCIFFFLGNISPRYRSKHLASYLVAVAKSEDISQYHLDVFLKPFVDDLKTLFLDGINIKVDNEERKLHGALLAFLGDNLAAHQLGGFKESSSFSLRICRTCMVTVPESQNITKEDDCLLRTSECHERHCLALTGPLHQHFSTTYGINRRSILEDVPGFSVVTGLPHDIMHDLFEGVVKLEMKLFLAYCVSKKFFTLQEVNNRICCYDFSDSKPSLIEMKSRSPKEYKLRQSASQMINLIREFPLLIGDKIPLSDRNYYSLLLLLKICEIALSPSLSPDTVPYLRILVEEKLILFKHLYGSQSSLIPKMHFMIHYGTQIEKYGPLVHAWTMRQEAKLSFIKRVSQRGNFKNVPFTVAKIHQFWLSYKLSNSNITNVIPEVGKATETLLVSEIEELKLQFSSCLCVTPNTIVKHPNWVRLQNFVYQKRSFLLLQYDAINPVFGEIVHISVVEKVIIFYVVIHKTDCFSVHFNSFVIFPSVRSCYINVENLRIPHPLLAHKSFNKTDRNLYINLPFYIHA